MERRRHTIDPSDRPRRRRSDPRHPTDDDALIRWMLGLTPAERLAAAQGFVDSVAALDRARVR